MANPGESSEESCALWVAGRGRCHSRLATDSVRRRGGAATSGENKASAWLQNRCGFFEETLRALAPSAFPHSSEVLL